MMKITRILSFVLSLVMVLSLLAGCADPANSNVEDPDGVVTDAPDVTDAPEVTTTEAYEAIDSGSVYENYIAYQTALTAEDTETSEDAE